MAFENQGQTTTGNTSIHDYTSSWDVAEPYYYQPNYILMDQVQSISSAKFLHNITTRVVREMKKLHRLVLRTVLVVPELVYTLIIVIITIIKRLSQFHASFLDH